MFNFFLMKSCQPMMDGHFSWRYAKFFLYGNLWFPYFSSCYWKSLDLTFLKRRSLCFNRNSLFYQRGVLLLAQFVLAAHQVIMMRCFPGCSATLRDIYFHPRGCGCHRVCVGLTRVHTWCRHVRYWVPMAAREHAVAVGNSHQSGRIIT